MLEVAVPDVRYATLHICVVDLIVVNIAEHNFDSPVGYLIQKSAIVRNQHYCRGMRNQKVFEPLDGFYVEMICGLIEKQHVVILQQSLASSMRMRIRR